MAVLHRYWQEQHHTDYECLQLKHLNHQRLSRLPFYEPFSLRVQKAVKRVVWVYCLLQFILYDPYTNLKAYYFLYPARLTVQQYLYLEDRIYAVTHTINTAVILLCFLGLLAAFIKAPKLKLFRYNHLFLAISYATLAFVYIYFISSSPDFYLKVSRIAGTYSYRSLQLGSNAFIYRALPYILVPPRPSSPTAPTC